MKRFFKKLGQFALVAIAAIALFMATRVPRNDRLWDDELAMTATAAFAPDGQVTIRKLRDFTYGDRTVAGKRWLAPVRLDPSKVTRLWFVLEPFAAWKAVGHTFLTFEFSDGSAYSFSVEARKTKDEHYSAFLGLFNTYELAYTWGTERDFLTRRILYLDHPVYMYPTAVTAGEAQAVFKALLAKTNDIAAHPRFYNSLTENCTNVLARAINDLKPGAVPWSYTWYFPGHSDRFLARTGHLAVRGDFDSGRERYRLSSHRAAILAHAGDPQFSRFARALLPAAP